MAHIQQGDQRQYFASESPVDFSGQVANILGQGLNTGVSITQKANESTMASNQIDLSTKFLAKNNEMEISDNFLNFIYYLFNFLNILFK